MRTNGVSLMDPRTLKFYEVSLCEALTLILEKKHPTVVNFETRTKCNSFCEFCPAAVQNEIREDTQMPVEIFEKVVQDLSAREYKNILCFQLNNEPLLDDRIVDFIAYANKELPEARKKIVTNGTFLTLEKAKALVQSGISLMVVDNYSPNTKYTEALKEIEAYIKDTHPNVNLSVQYNRNLKEIKSNRGGRARTDTHKMSDIIQEKANLKNNYPCYRPFSSLTTTTDGRIGLCCYDVYFDLCIGNIKDGNVLDTYHNEKATKIRLELLRANRSFVKCCDFCDVFYCNDFQLRKDGLSNKEMQIQ